MKLYHENGFANMPDIMSVNVPFIFIIGGRGTGKTYGALSDIVDNDRRFMLMRRTQAQCDMISRPEFSPFKAVMNDRDSLNITCKSVSKYNSAFYRGDEGAPIGYTCALSTISNMRGFDASDVEIILYDEFIPETHERPIKNEGDAFLNAYETINRNRELFGRAPVKMVALSNANNLACPIFQTLRLIDDIDKMIRKRRQYFIDYKRGVAVFMLQNSPVSAAKKQTALYKLTDDTEFEAMSLNNEFSADDYTNVKPQPIKEYVSVCMYDDICFYKHKSNGTWYVSRHVIGSPVRFRPIATDRAQFTRLYRTFPLLNMYNQMYFADFYCKNKVYTLFDIT